MTKPPLTPRKRLIERAATYAWQCDADTRDRVLACIEHIAQGVSRAYYVSITYAARERLISAVMKRVNDRKRVSKKR